MVKTIILVPGFDVTRRLIRSDLSEGLSSPVRAKVECYKPRDYFSYQVMDCSSLRDPVFEHYGSPFTLAWGGFRSQ